MAAYHRPPRRLYPPPPPPPYRGPRPPARPPALYGSSSSWWRTGGARPLSSTLSFFQVLRISEYPMCIFPKKWSANRRSLSSRLRYAPQTSQTCSFWWPDGPEVSWRFLRSRSRVSFWCFAVRTLCISLRDVATEPVSPRTDTSSRPLLIVLERSAICLSWEEVSGI